MIEAAAPTSITRQKKRTRKGPSPNSILDRRALVEALDDRGLNFKPFVIDSFYQSLHRQHYPDLSDFYDNYYRHEQEAKQRLASQNTNSSKKKQQQRPLKNNISARKNFNKAQLPRKLLEFIRDPENGFVTVTSKVAQQKTSADGTTSKLAIQLHDGQLVESVLMRYITKDGSRASLCVSSQCGCAMGCTFCATGTMGLSGNLTTGEILEQIVHADRILAAEWRERQKENVIPTKPSNNNKQTDNLDLVRNVVFMGMGEPLDNYTNVVQACRALIDCKRWNLAHGRVTVSTVGLVPQIRKLTAELPQVALAVSLHAPNQEARSAIVPAAKHFPIQDIVDALDGHMVAYLRQRYPDATEFTLAQRQAESSRRRAMIEYVMLEGETSTFECAHQLGKLCQGKQLVINLIPYNATDVRDKLRCPSPEHIEEFRKIVNSYGPFCTVRRTMGADIDSACGQLITLEKNKHSPADAAAVVVDIEDTAKPLLASSSSSSKPSVDGDDSSPPSNKEIDWGHWVLPLSVATTVAAATFVVSTSLLIRTTRNNRR